VTELLDEDGMQIEEAEHLKVTEEHLDEDGMQFEGEQQVEVLLVV